MKIKLIALDLDDSTLGKGGILSEYNRSALFAAIENGIEIVVASGRNYPSLPSCITDIPGIKYAIVSNGAAVYDISKGKCLSRQYLPKSAVEIILREQKKHEYCRAEVISDSIAYASADYLADPMRFSPPTLSPHIVEYLQATRTPVDDFYAFAYENADRLDCINLTFTSASSRIQFQEKISSLTDELYLTSSIGHLLEISNKNTGKGAGLRTVCKLLNIPMSQTAACGNGDNDIDMLSSAYIGAAVENATDLCKAAADIIIERNTENGVGKFIYNLISRQQKAEEH